MKTILLTGVTGQIGSALAPILQDKGYSVLYLSRPSGEKTGQMRLAEVLSKVREGMDIAISGDVTLQNVGMSHEDIVKWNWEVDIIVHSAASVAFDESTAEKLASLILKAPATCFVWQMIWVVKIFIM